MNKVAPGVWALQPNPGRKATGIKPYPSIFVLVCVYQVMFPGAETYCYVTSHTYELQEGQLALNDEPYHKGLLNGVLLACE